MVTVRLRIFGRVQGVGYRYWALQTARGMSLSGWVRNLNDGTVEIAAAGSEERIATFTAACQAGPTLARVTEVRTLPYEGEPLAAGFSQLPTGTADPA